MRQVVVTITPYRQQIRRYLPDDIQTAIRASCSDRFISTKNSLLILELPSTCAIQFREDQIVAALDALDEYRLFERELVQRLASIDITVTAVEAHLLLIDSLVEELRSRLQ